GKWSAKKSSARLRFFTARAERPLWNSKNLSTQIQRMSVSESAGWVVGWFIQPPNHPTTWLVLARPELALDVLGDQIDREQVWHPAHFGVLLEVAQVGKRHALAQLLETVFRDLAVLDEIGIAGEDC